MSTEIQVDESRKAGMETETKIEVDQRSCKSLDLKAVKGSSYLPPQATDLHWPDVTEAAMLGRAQSKTPRRPSTSNLKRAEPQDNVRVSLLPGKIGSCAVRIIDA